MKLAPGSYWITRDSDAGGHLGDECDVWRERPIRLASGDGWMWLSAEWSTETRVGTVGVAAVRNTLGTAPDTDRECLRFER